jgi:hypothetical protein
MHPVGIFFLVSKRQTAARQQLAFGDKFGSHKLTLAALESIVIRSRGMESHLFSTVKPVERKRDFVVTGVASSFGKPVRCHRMQM